MSVYYKENPEWFKQAVQSMLDQSIKPSEFVIICDGQLTHSLDAIIHHFVKTNKKLFKIIRLDKNVGLGPALRRGILECSNELIARMDSDDYCKDNRIKKQLDALADDPELDMVGTNVEEFYGSVNNIISHVILPENNEDIIRFSKRRCPFRHPSLLYKKSSILKVGNYREYYLFEDYDLYIRLIKNGAKSKNIQEPLTYMRISKDFYKRRGGLRYANSIVKFKTEQYKTGYFSLFDYVISTIPHVIICLSPNFVRDIFYKTFLRKRAK